MQQILENLNPNQLQAVTKTFKNNTLVLAGAGSGKTGVLTRRTAYLIESGVYPEEIMVVTFTNKAATEMKNRISKLIGNSKTKKIMMGTFHSIALKMIRPFYSELGLKENFYIVDEDDQSKLVKEALEHNALNSDKKNINIYVSYISSYKNKLVYPQELISHPDINLYKVYSYYQAKLKSINALDFDDIIMNLVYLLDNYPKIKKDYQDKYSYIQVDEYQDTNYAQYKVLLSLYTSHTNMFVVGDDSQSIYGFRGSDVSIIRNFLHDFPNSKTIKLEENYRSTKNIVETANFLISHNKKKLEKVCYTYNTTGNPVKVLTFNGDKLEADFIAREIFNLTTYSNFKPSDIAILYRNNSISATLEKSLINYKIPYQIIGGIKFYERAEIKDLLSYLRLICHPYDDLSFKRVILMHKGIGKSTLKNISEYAVKNNLHLYEACKLYTPNKQVEVNAINEFRNKLNLIFSYYNSNKDSSIVELIKFIINATSYLEYLNNTYSDKYDAKVENINEFGLIINDYETSTEDSNLLSFINDLSLSSSQDKSKENSVQLMTIHMSKGLEFKAVFLPAWEEGVIPSVKSFTQDELEEERRLAYVAITRAEQELYISNAKTRNLYGRVSPQLPSKFLKELPAQNIITI